MTSDYGIQEFFASTAGTVYLTVLLALYVLWIVACWRVFSKAGYWGILALIPIVNAVILVRIAGYSGWLVLLYVIPIVNIVFSIIVAIKVGERFGKGGFFSVFWLWLFPFIGYFIIGFGQARYTRA
ncbi:MAG: DUF5684 domain-containing protein [Leucobacter sp.]|mgnify:CR=1 FL=1